MVFYDTKSSTQRGVDRVCFHGVVTSHEPSWTSQAIALGWTDRVGLPLSEDCSVGCTLIGHVQSALLPMFRDAARRRSFLKKCLRSVHGPTSGIAHTRHQILDRFLLHTYSAQFMRNLRVFSAIHICDLKVSYDRPPKANTKESESSESSQGINSAGDEACPPSSNGSKVIRSWTLPLFSDLG